MRKTLPTTRMLSDLQLTAAALALALSATDLNAQVRFSGHLVSLSGDSTRVVTVGGREVLQMETGVAEVRDVALKDGTIDVDVMVTTRRSFVYVNFRIQGEGEREEFYLRPHKSSLPDAVQYAPAFQDEGAWQLYHGARGTASPVIEPDIWQRLRIVLSGTRAAFFLGDTVKPMLVLPHLAREPRAGGISLSSFVPGGTRPGRAAARFSNLRVREGVIAYDFSDAPAMPALRRGTVETWDVGVPFAAPDTAVWALAPEWLARFAAVPVEPDGFVELHRHLKLPQLTGQGYAGVVAKFRVEAQSAGQRRFDLGFSDRATVFVNGKPVFTRDDSYDFANRRDGLISFDQASVYLPLNAGSNEIAVVVADRFGGWGIMGRFPDMTGLRIQPAAGGPSPTEHSLPGRRAELMRVHDDFNARASRDFIGAVADVIAKDGFYGAAMPTLGKGPEAARAFLVKDSFNLTSRALLEVVRLDVSADGNDAYSYGYLDVIRANGDTLPGGFKAYWRRNAAGRWEALAFGRGRRDRGTKTWLPDSLQSAPSLSRKWPGDSLSWRSALEATELAFSDSGKSGLQMAFVSFAAPDAGKIQGSGYVFGRSLMGDDFRAVPPDFPGMAWHAEWGTVSSAGDLGFNAGPVSRRGGAAGGGGLFITVWKRQPNGEWKYLVD